MRRRDPFSGRRLLLAVTDAILAFFIGYVLLKYSPRGLQGLGGTCMAAVTTLSLSLSGGYIHVVRRPASWHRYSAGLAAAFSGLGIWCLIRTEQATQRPAEIVLASALLFAALLAIRLLLVHLHRVLLGKKRLWVIAGDAAAAHQLASKVQGDAGWYELIRASGPPSFEELEEGLPAIEAVLCTPSLRAQIQPACQRMGKEFLLLPDPSEVLLYSARAHQIDDLMVLSLPALRRTAGQRLLKRGLDIVVSALLIALSAPIMAVLYFLIPCDSPGRPIYRQTRRGLDGRPFEILKFRTMFSDAERLSGPVLASRQDLRVTRLGHFLRATRCDELPQLFNVLRGDMSLVGPRPEREFFASRFDDKLPGYHLRTTLKPGVTGLAQVWGKYSTIAEDKLRLDLLYIANHSLSLDVHLLLHTLRVVLHGGQSAGVDASPISRFNFSPIAAIGKQPET